MRPANNVVYPLFPPSLTVAISYPTQRQGKTSTHTIQYLPDSYSYQTAPTLLQIHIKSSKTKSRKEKKRKEKVKYTEKTKKNKKREKSCSNCTHTPTPIRSLILFHSLTHNCPCPPRLRVSIILDNRSPPHPRPLLAVVTCLLLSSLRVPSQTVPPTFLLPPGKFIHLESRYN
ncbi:hypothetical protein L873DRAFT_929289 [Choiromyces venosus 120613-1]|uniref:Uncharacterized protein n=1 Tax=Choiromyces venosus 120613-1 TaxID=1336337 RepID=A0A3N4JLN9_9PEZI|nr:hypothetical protein L873DRAFT_929289 [Choiromyces venosus 120613-1]